MRRVIRLVVCLSFYFALPDRAVAEPPPLIPIDTLFPDWSISMPHTAPDGKTVGYLLIRDNVTEVRICILDSAYNVVVVTDTGFGVNEIHWAEDNVHLLYSRDLPDHDATHIFSYDRFTGHTRDLTPDSAMNYYFARSSTRYPTRIGVYRYDGIRATLDPCVVDVATGEFIECEPNPGDYDFWAFDEDLRVRAAVTMVTDFALEPRVIARAGLGQEFKEVFKIKGSNRYDAYTLFVKDSNLYALDSRDGDKKSLKAYNVYTKKRKTVIEDKAVDVSEVFDLNGSFFGRVGYYRPLWVSSDPEYLEDCVFLNDFWGGSWRLYGTDSTYNLWSISSEGDVFTPHFFLYDRRLHDAPYELPLYPVIDPDQLSPTRSFIIKTKGGVTVPCLLTMPIGIGDKRAPLVVKVHGGPHSRDEWGFDGENQFLANRGWAVLQMNFRGSDGYGEEFLYAGIGEWSTGILDDMFGAIDHVWANEFVEKRHTVIYGASFGGYAALMAAVREPDRFAGGIAFAPVTDLGDLLTFSRRAKNYEHHEALSVLLPGELDPDELRRASPVFRADRIKIPFLLAHGSRDTRIPVRQTERMAEELEKSGKKVELIVYPNATHTSMSVENQRHFAARMELFLADILKTK